MQVNGSLPDLLNRVYLLFFHGWNTIEAGHVYTEGGDENGMWRWSFKFVVGGVVVVVFLSLSLSPRSTRGPGEFVIQLLGPAESLRPFACRRQKK